MQNMVARVSKAARVIKAILDLTVNYGWWDGRTKAWAGRKVRVVEAEAVTLSDLASDGGTQNYYWSYRLNDLAATGLLYAQEGSTWQLRADEALVCHSWFQGKDCGVTIYVKPVADREALLVIQDMLLDGCPVRRDQALDMLKAVCPQPGAVDLYVELLTHRVS